MLRTSRFRDSSSKIWMLGSSCAGSARGSNPAMDRPACRSARPPNLTVGLVAVIMMVVPEKPFDLG